MNFFFLLKLLRQILFEYEIIHSIFKIWFIICVLKLGRTVLASLKCLLKCFSEAVGYFGTGSDVPVASPVTNDIIDWSNFALVTTKYRASVATRWVGLRAHTLPFFLLNL